MTSALCEAATASGRVLVFDALALHARDTVATALRALARGETVRVGGLGQGLSIVLLQPVPLCHKFALAKIGVGTEVTKYGESIGKASRDIAPGEHVHVHNLVSARARQSA